MHFLVAVLRLATAATILLASSSLASLTPTPTHHGTLSINPPSTGLNLLSGLDLGSVISIGFDTNSQRLAHGLGPLPPRSLAAKKSRLGKFDGTCIQFNSTHHGLNLFPHSCQKVRALGHALPVVRVYAGYLAGRSYSHLTS